MLIIEYKKTIRVVHTKMSNITIGGNAYYAPYNDLKPNLTFNYFGGRVFLCHIPAKYDQLGLTFDQNICKR